MLLKITLKCFSLRVILDLLNQVVNVNTMWSFHHRFWHAGDVEVDVFVINRKVELVRVWRCSITMFERTNFLHFVRAFFHRFPRSIVITHDAIVFIFHRFLRSIINWFGLGWLRKTSLKCFSKWLLNEFSNWLMFNCRTRLIISFSPIVIVFQRDLWWWSRRTNIVFHTTSLQFSIFQLLKYNGLVVFLEE